MGWRVLEAVKCILDGLEHLNENSFAIELVCTSLFGQTLIAEITHRNQDSVKGVLHDTSNSFDLNLNEKLLSIITNENSNPVIPKDNDELEVYIGSVSKKGEVYIQIPGPELNWIVQILKLLGTELISQHKLTSFRQVKMNKIYLAKYSQDDCFYRANVSVVSFKQNKIAVQFIDFGNEETVSISDIAAPDLSPILSKLPAQAIKVALHSLPIESMTDSMIARLKAMLMDDEKTIIMKTVSSQENPPVVEIFYRNDAENNQLMSVNNSIAQSQLLESPDLNNTSGNGIFNNQSDIFCVGLKPPQLDEDFTPVFVTLAANPTNFVFQPVKYIPELENLNREMQYFFEEAELPVLDSNSIIKGKVYAALYTDDQWYRVVVTGDISGFKVPVRFCDYGDVAFISISDLRELRPQFYQVPFLAVKGKLAGVSPTHTDWSVDDCVRFQFLVLNKCLASSITNIDNDPLNPMEMLVSLNLVDTSTDEDLVISDVLVEEMRAFKIS